MNGVDALTAVSARHTLRWRDARDRGEGRVGNQFSFYLQAQLEGERENDRYGHRVACGDVDGDGHEEWVIAASTATLMQGEGGVNPLSYPYCGRIYVLSGSFRILFTLQGNFDGGCFGASFTLTDIDGDGAKEIVVGAPRANSPDNVQCGAISVFSGKTSELLHRWYGNEDYARLGSAVEALDWNADGLPEVAVSSHLSGPRGEDWNGRVTLYAIADGHIVEQWEGADREGFGSSLAAGDVDGDGRQELIVAAPASSNSGLVRSGRVLVYSPQRGLIHQSCGKRPFDEYGHSLAIGDIDGDGTDDLLVGSPGVSGIRRDPAGAPSNVVLTRCGMACGWSIILRQILFEKEGWFPEQGLGMSIHPYIDRTSGLRYVLAGSRAGAAYIMDLRGRIAHEFNGCEPEWFSHAVSQRRGAGGSIAIGAVAGANQKQFMSGRVYIFSPDPPAASAPEPFPQAAGAKNGHAEAAPFAAAGNAAGNAAGDTADDIAGNAAGDTAGNIAGNIAGDIAGNAADDIAGDIAGNAAVDLAKRGPMNILLCTYWYLPHVGGVDVYVRLLKDELERMGHRVDVLAHHPDMAHYYLAGGDRTVDKWRIKRIVYDRVTQFYQRHLPQVEPWIRYRDIERYCFEVAAAMYNLEQYDMIHTQDIVSTRALSRVKPASTPLVATIHGLLAKEHVIAGDIVSEESLGWRYVAAEEFYGCTSADVTIVPTEWLRTEMTHFSVPREQLTVIPYGMNIEAFERRCDLPLSAPAPKPGAFTICCPARLVPVKGHKTLLDALRQLADDPSWHCWFAGDGPLRPELQQAIETLGLTGRVTLLGDRDDMPALLRQADLMALPSLQDNLPFSIMEAQIAGIPIVASNAGGIPEMIRHEHTGLLFEAGNPSQLAACIRRMMDDPPLRGKLAQAGNLWAYAEWSDTTLLERTLSAYGEAQRRVAAKDSRPFRQTER